MPQVFQHKNIIVTGASSGIGEHLVWHIAKKGWTPIMIARTFDKLKELQEKIWKTFHLTAPAYQVNITDISHYQTILEKILDDHKQIHGLINNAGIGLFASVDAIEQDSMEYMFRLNVYGLIEGTKQIVTHFSANRRICHIVNVASMAGKIATPKSSIYAATKHAVLGFTNALRLEVAQKRIYVTSVNLGPVKTNFFDTADPDGIYQKNVSNYMLDPDKVAKKIVKHLFRKKREINLPYWMAAGSKLYQLFPGFIERVLQKSFHKK